MINKFKNFSICIACILYFYIIFGLCFRVSNYFFVAEVKAFQDTLTEQRNQDTAVELTAISDRIVDTNIKIEKMKELYEIEILKIGFCKDFENLQPIK